MSKIKGDPKNIIDLFKDAKKGFRIPDYQRPYAWTEKECQTLWDDFVAFSIPDNNKDNFDESKEWFLGPIVVFTGNDGRQEVIDGQQRITTILLLLRALYDKFQGMKDDDSKSTREMIEKCIWGLDNFERVDKNALKIVSEVITDKDDGEFRAILSNGLVDEKSTSNYASNYNFFVAQIETYNNEYCGYLPFVATRVLHNVILLPIIAESQDVALNIFSTLNDRGKPLSDADIFKAQLYRIYSAKGGDAKSAFIERWKGLEEKSEEVFGVVHGSPMDEAFTRYMYFVRAQKRIKASTTKALRVFYDEWSILKQADTFDNIVDLFDFWRCVSERSKDRGFSDEVIRNLYVLSYAPNSMWTYFVSVYYMSKKDGAGKLDNDAFAKFLEKTIAFIWAFVLIRPGVNQLRTPLYSEMIKLVDGADADFAEFRFEESDVRTAFNNFIFSNGRPITKSMLVWWAMHFGNQPIPRAGITFEIEHIYAKGRQNADHGLKNPKNLESLGNKAILEKTINIRAAEYHFADKRKFYRGEASSAGKVKEKTCVVELLELVSSADDFVEKDIETRYGKILEAFITFLKDNALLK